MIRLWYGTESWLELRDYEYWIVKVLSDWHYPLLWVLSTPNHDIGRPENVTCMTEKEYHLHPIEMSAEMKYDYHRAIMARPGRDREQDWGKWIRELQGAMYDSARAEGKAFRRQVEPRNPYPGIIKDIRCAL